MIPLHDDIHTELKPYVTIALVIICLVVFLWQLSLGTAGQNAIVAFGAIAAVIFDYKQLPSELSFIPVWMSIFTSLFLHGGWMHLISNLLFLWVFGNNVEDAMGHKRFILFYLLCGVISVFAQLLPDPQSTAPLIGASGAISGVLGAYVLLYPHARILVMVPIVIIMHTV
ncbi:MAG: rhomboid family intramembrane serine protease, partial [Gammaproteobacteria bacterium]|nr:rhomboid family intramembrane serine protease [Gammaproteobacteria bacterium]